MFILFFTASSTQVSLFIYPDSWLTFVFVAVIRLTSLRLFFGRAMPNKVSNIGNKYGQSVSGRSINPSSNASNCNSQCNNVIPNDSERIIYGATIDRMKKP